MPRYNRGDPPKDLNGVLPYLDEETQRILNYANQPEVDGVWDDLRFPAQAINIPGPSGAPTWDTTNIGLGFSASAQNDVQFIAQMPHSWQEGSEIRPHIHWEANTGFTIGTAVVWCMYVRWRNNGGTLAAQTAYTVTATPTSTLALLVTSFPALDGANMEISSILDLQLSRLATATGDSLTATAILKEFDIHYQVDGFGSSREESK